jgi:DNA-binding response OmpR family regulator
MAAARPRMRRRERRTKDMPGVVKVAVVDDSAVALAWARETLERAGFEVATYNSSLGIQAFVRAQHPILVLLDVCMPALRGDAVCKMIKSNPATALVRVVLYSSLPEDELRQRAVDAGADAYIVKSADGTELVRSIRLLLAPAPGGSTTAGGNAGH